MKNQYFGDNRDLFKFDLIQKIVGSLPNRRLTYIPMLTLDEGNKHGEKRERKQTVGNNNNCLIDFFEPFKLHKDLRDVRKIKDYFNKNKIYTEIIDDYFERHREYPKEYFTKIPDELLNDSFIFLDPDTGIAFEIKKPSSKHILFNEIKNLYERMGNQSIVMVIQFLLYKKQNEYFSKIKGGFKEEIGIEPKVISDNQIAFFFLTKDVNINNKLAISLASYTQEYPKLSMS